MNETSLFDRDALVRHLRQLPAEDQRPQEDHTLQAQEEAERRAAAEPPRIVDPALRKERIERERAQRAFAERAEIRKRSGTARAEILRGLQRGEPIEALFLAACRAISDMTGDAAFSDRAEKDLLTIYGKALRQPAALATEAGQYERRAAALSARLENEPMTDDEADTLRRAIRAQKEKAAEIRAAAARQESAQSGEE